MPLLLDMPMLKTFQLQGASPPDQALDPDGGSRSALAKCPPHMRLSRVSAPGKQFLPRPLLRATCNLILKQ